MRRICEMLSKRENQILSLNAVGLTPVEIGDILYIPAATVQTTLRNMKRKLQLQVLYIFVLTFVYKYKTLHLKRKAV